MKLVSLPLFALCAIISVSAHAQETQDMFSAGFGVYDILDGDRAADFKLEYRSGDQFIWKLKPWGGVEFTTHGSIWAGGGINADIPVAENIYIIPSFGAGLYTKGGSDVDLDHPIQFRSQIEGAYEFENAHRVGLAFSHFSNADMGDSNPGTEVLNLYYHVPFAEMFNTGY